MQDAANTLFESFQEICRKYPQKKAIFFTKDDKHTFLTYQDIYNRAVQLIHFLVKYDIKKGDAVALILENSPRWPIVFMALMQRGSVVVPLDPQSEKEELKNILLHSGVKFIFTSRVFYLRLAEAAEDTDITVVVLDSDKTAQEINVLGQDSPPQSYTLSADIALILYTSGTTATPKGVVLTHKNLLANVRSLQAANLINENDCFISILPFYHAYPLMVNLLLPLLSGIKLSFPSSIDTRGIMECIRATGVTVFVGVPRVFYLFHETIARKIYALGFIKRTILYAFLDMALFFRRFFRINIAKFMLKDIHSRFGECFRFMISGGAKLNKDIANSFYKWGFTIFEGYGLTETSPVVTFNLPDSFRLGSVGKPVSGVEIMLYDKDNKGRGEIIVKGDNVTGGYYKQQEPGQKAIRGRWFFTGDIGYIDKHGFLYIQNRIKDIIVLSSGKNINPDELEAYYSNNPYIEEICVFLAPRGPLLKEELLSAAILPDYEVLRVQGIENLKDRIRLEMETMSRKLPSYKRIKKYTIINQKLARTALGKVKRYEIKEQYRTRGEDSKPDRSFSDEDRKLLSHPLCKKAYDYLCKKANKAISLNDNLEIDLGIDSLEQVGLLIDFQQLAGIQIEDEDVFSIYTVRDIFQILFKMPVQFEGGQEEHRALSWSEIFKQPAKDEVKDEVVINQTLLQKNISAFVWLLAKCLSFLLFRLEVKGAENIPAQGPLIICPRHASFLDGPLIFSCFKNSVVSNVYFLGFKRYFDNPVVSRVKKPLRLISLEGGLDVTNALHKCSYVLNKGKILCLFPEGVCSPDGSIQEFKRGLGVLIKELNVPAIPVYIKGDFEAWPRYRKFPRPYKITIIFGKKMTSDDLSSKDRGGIDIYKNIVHNLRNEMIQLEGSSN